jgi:hypothetical protein
LAVKDDTKSAANTKKSLDTCFTDSKILAADQVAAKIDEAKCGDDWNANVAADNKLWEATCDQSSWEAAAKWVIIDATTCSTMGTMVDKNMAALKLKEKTMTSVEKKAEETKAKEAEARTALAVTKAHTALETCYTTAPVTAKAD